jgi:small subunit ribosomal protein S16
LGLVIPHIEIKNISRIDMTTIRLTRMGRKKMPFYRIVVTDSRKRRDGGWIESIGHYNPMIKEDNLTVDSERMDYWVSVGAQMSDRVRRITGR